MRTLAASPTMEKTNTENLYTYFLAHPKICTDTRKIDKDSLFFALKGENFNGNKFALQALQEGAAYAIVDEPEFLSDSRCLLVDDVLTALQQLARHHRMQLDIPVIGITGSNGKTTTKELVACVLRKKFKTHYTLGNLNNHIGVPLTLLAMPADTEIAVIEMGANHQGEIRLLSAIACPTHGIVSNVGLAHLEGFGGFEGVKKGKAELFDFLLASNGLAFVNRDNPHLMEMSANLSSRVLYGADGPVDCRGELLESVPQVSMKWIYRNLASGEIKANISGSYNFENILAAVTIGCHFAVPADKIDAAVNDYVPSNMRSQMIHKEQCEILLDAYNANPTSMKAAIENFATLKADKKTLILGDMMELGTHTDEEHRRLLQAVFEHSFERVILVGDYFGNSKANYPVLHFQDTELVAEWLRANQVKGATYLIKGSRKMQLEKLVDCFV